MVLLTSELGLVLVWCVLFFSFVMVSSMRMIPPTPRYPSGYKRSRSMYRNSDAQASMSLGMETGESADADSTILYSVEEKVSHEEPRSPITRVITDIDDTVKSSGGKKILGISLGGIDTQFKRGEFYPGVFQFALELSRKKVSKPIPMVSEESGRPSMKLVQHLANLHLNIGTKSSSVVQGLGAVKTIVGKTSSEVQKVIPARVGVLTARAKEFKFALALKPGDRLCSAFRETGRKNGFGSDWGIGSVYYGSAAEWVVTSWKGLRKFENFELMMESDRSVTKGRGDQYILVGDTGEKDEQAGEYIAKKYPDSLRAVFLHVVSENPDVKQVQVPRDRTVGKVPIFYFRTYVGAASKAVRNELMTIDGLKRIIDQAQVDLGVKDEKRFHDLVKTELTEDITEARQLVYSVEQEIMFLKMDKTASTLR